MSAKRIDHGKLVAYLIANPTATAEQAGRAFKCTGRRVLQVARQHSVLRGWMRKEKP